ncbi:MAG: hypothetical protein ABF289_13565 [Clostridiales bacterium]
MRKNILYMKNVFLVNLLLLVGMIVIIQDINMNEIMEYKLYY